MKISQNVVLHFNYILLPFILWHANAFTPLFCFFIFLTLLTAHWCDKYLRIMMIFSTLIYIFFGNSVFAIFRTVYIGDVMEDHLFRMTGGAFQPNPWTWGIFRLVCFFIALIFIWLVLKLMRNRRIRRDGAFFICFVGILLYILGTYLRDQPYLAAVIVLGAIAVFIKVIWSVLYLGYRKEPLKNPLSLILIHPFFYLAPPPLWEPNDLIDFKRQPEMREKLRNQASSILWQCFLWYLAYFCFTIVFWRAFPDLVISDFEAFMVLDLPLWKVSLAVATHFLVYFVIILGINANLIAVLLLYCGFNVHLSFWSPQKATSFLGLITRVMFYYALLIERFFFVPFLNRTRFLRRLPKFRIFVSVFAGIFFGGVFFHFFRDFYGLTIFGFPTFVKQFVLGYFPFIATMALLCAGGTLVGERHWLWQNKIYAFLYRSFLFLSFAVLILMAKNYNVSPFGDKVDAFIKYLNW